MRARRRRGTRTVLPLAAAFAVTSGVVAACEPPVPFHRPGEGAPDDPVVGLGGAAPYVELRTPRPARDPAPARVYAATGPGMLAPAARALPRRLYVATRRSVAVVDPLRLRVVDHLPAGGAARVVPSWDMRRLWAADPRRGALVPLGPAGTGRAVPVPDPAGLYFTPDGELALVLSRRPRRVGIRDPRTMRPRAAIRMPCAARHADFSLDGRGLVASCTGAGALVGVDVRGRRVARTLRLPAGARPGDVRLSPDGRTFYVADAAKGGVWLVDAATFAAAGFVRTSPGAAGLAVGRDAHRLFVAGDGYLAVLDFRTRAVTARWPLPGRAAPVVGGVSADGTALWLAAPPGVVYSISTVTGRVLHHLRVPGRPTSLVVHPQPGRYSLGGTGLYR
ncbi:YncE family protein [Actinomadura algeriensis]|uniref:DNA-binding beta-propeller fold protein YncE n=1 Tax=Actinomadura algeriensis TaxID=1679523 RepID=A0ABR9JT26_9ACTN|nr:YncE family protein [Actinomadura algeriensis]MBE1533724.1 DNA-binding beta-propeller fold protein YncE [Actinomadura algeriensis]